jgi:hypothetical protein
MTGMRLAGVHVVRDGRAILDGVSLALADG